MQKHMEDMSSFTNPFTYNFQLIIYLFSQMSNLGTYFRIHIRHGLLILERA